VFNLRDLGDYVTEDGDIVRRGLVCHANQLSGITPEDMGWLDELEMATVRERPEGDIAGQSRLAA
jgi:hypothetical protein